MIKYLTVLLNTATLIRVTKREIEMMYAVKDSFGKAKKFRSFEKAAKFSHPDAVEFIESKLDKLKESAKAKKLASLNKLSILKSFNLSAKKYDELVEIYKIERGIDTSDVVARNLTFIEFLKINTAA